MENVAIKGRGGNDVRHKKNWKGKILRIWITIIRHGGLGHEVQDIRGEYWFRGSWTEFYRPNMVCHEKIVLKIKSIVIRTANNLFRKVHNYTHFKG